MEHDPAHIRNLLIGFIDNRLAPHELEQLFNFIEEDPESYARLMNSKEIKDLLRANAGAKEFVVSEQTSKRMRDRLMASIQSPESSPNRPLASVHSMRYQRILRWSSVAAIVLLGIGTATWYMIGKKPVSEIASTEKPTLLNDVTPGGNKAVLTLSNGAKIVLDSAANGTLAQQGNARISKVNSGLLAYNLSIEKPTEILFNTLSTPRGGQYKLILPDGTAVWLNAASTITYPTAFKGNERKVSITGEAYFEVTKDKTKPFYVKVNQMEVEVLGTHFNINAYSDEKTINTTLLEGSVKIKKDNQVALLKPGQQAQSNGQVIKIVRDVNLNQVMAWKNGFFNFNNADLQLVMRQLGRWYDVEVIYEREIPKIQFMGEIERDLNLSDVLDVLKRTNVHFRIEGKKIIVLP